KVRSTGTGVSETRNAQRETSRSVTDCDPLRTFCGPSTKNSKLSKPLHYIHLAYMLLQSLSKYLGFATSSS
ncbi:uncharacterized protein B0H18DRAFT_1064825, partial [Fomitopsis serialis]